MVDKGARVVVDVEREHGPQLPGMLVGDGNKDLAERQAGRKAADPQLFGRGVVSGDDLGTVEGRARALNQQGTQVTVTAAADGAKVGMPAAGVLARRQAYGSPRVPPSWAGKANRWAGAGCSR